MKIISSLQHPFVKHLVKLQTSSRYRQECSTVVVEGIKMVRELLSEGVVKNIFMTQACFDAGSWQSDAICIVTNEIIKKISSAQAPEGVVAEVVMPAQKSLAGLKKVLVLDRVTDPGNVGTLIRSALAFGWQGVYLIEGSCDPFNDKALRAAKGATFRLPWRLGSWSQFHEEFMGRGVRILAADMVGMPPANVKFDDRGLLLILGNEGQGLSDEACECSEKVALPMDGPMESLNVSVAGSILMYLFKGRN